ncbi:MAG: hypothetical protein U1E21_00860 [Reyranellaceae bacterium]
MASKTDALATFLTESQARAEKSSGPSPDDDSAFAGKVVLLTILAKQTEPMPLDFLRMRAELPQVEFDRVLNYLIQMRWVDPRDNGFCLTDAGREAAEQERQRLLRFG